MSTRLISSIHFGRNVIKYTRHQQQLAVGLLPPTFAGCNNSSSLDISTKCYSNYSIRRNYESRWSKLAPLPLQFHQLHWVPFAAPFGRHCTFTTKSTPDHAGKSDAKASAAITDDADLFAETSKLGLFAKFKLMYKKYWYVLIPVHIVTSIGWFGGFYYLSKSGIDVAALLQYMHLSEGIIERVQHSDMGHLAIAYLCYKIATPLRYALTLGGTTVSIKYLVQAGHIKPMPSKKEFIQMYEDKKAHRAAVKAEKEMKDKDESNQLRGDGADSTEFKSRPNDTKTKRRE